MIKRILVTLSGTSFTATATKYALDLAKLHKAEVTGVTDVDIAQLMNVGPVPVGGGAAARRRASRSTASISPRSTSSRRFKTSSRPVPTPE